MGTCCSSDSLPDVPMVIRPDPQISELMNVVTAKYGMWGRDYGIWDKEYPSNSDDRKQKVWMWFNKSSVEGNKNLGQIDLENFVRGQKEGQPDKGRVLYSVVITERPIFNMFQKRLDDNFIHQLVGFFVGAPADPKDTFYLHHSTHQHKLRAMSNGRNIDPDILTRWSLATVATFRDGDLGRGEEYFGKDPIHLEVFATGAVITSWVEEEVMVSDADGEGEHMEKRISKVETEFVDRIDFRLSFRGMIWCTWSVQGDSFVYDGRQDPTIDCPLFTTTIQGGWFSKSTIRTMTKPGVDPALAILIAHVCATEFSVEEIKRDLSVNTPSSHSLSFGITPVNPNYHYNSGITVNESTQFTMNIGM